MPASAGDLPLSDPTFSRIEPGGGTTALDASQIVIDRPTTVKYRANNFHYRISNA